MRGLRLLTACLIAFGSQACGAGAPADISDPNSAQRDPTMETNPVQDDATPKAKIPTHQVDSVAVGMTKTGVTALCDEHLRRAQALLEEVKALKSAADESLSYESVLGKVDDISFELSVGAGFPELMSVGHVDKAVRDAAEGCRPKVVKFDTNMMLDAEFAAVVKRYAATKPALSGTRKRLLSELLRDFRRNGLELSAADQTKLRALNKELTELEQQFERNLADARASLRVEPKRLKGLPESFIKNHAPGKDGLVEITTDYPDYFDVVSHAEDRALARDLTKLFDNRAADKNVPILEKVLILRERKAKLLGYETWADYAIEPRMAKTRAAVKKFLDKAAATVRAPAKQEYKLFLQQYRKIGGKANPIPNYDRLYLENLLRKSKFNFDETKLRPYFEIGNVTKGLMTIISKLYSIKIVEVKDAKTWHSDVKVIDLFEGSKKLGRIYLDLHPRDGKYKHAAMFEIRGGRRLSSGEYVTPIAALMCNFPKPGAGPALMTHSQVTTYFHEFGHALHHVLTQQALATYAGTNTVRDFVEAPSQMFEEWTYARETLDLFAKHHETGEKIPDDLFKAMHKSRTFGRALSTERQISLATLDFEYHSRPTPVKTDVVFTEVMKKTQQFSYLPETHFQATFGHLMGYDAAYYGYQWALAIARDVLTRFKSAGLMNAKVAADWRAAVLEPGAGADERDLVTKFLGRETNLEAYGEFLSGK